MWVLQKKKVFHTIVEKWKGGFAFYSQHPSDMAHTVVNRAIPPANYFIIWMIKGNGIAQLGVSVGEPTVRPGQLCQRRGPAESACLPPQRIQRALRGACRDTLQINSKVVTGTENVSDARPASTGCTAKANQEIGKRGKEWGLVQVCVGLVSKLQSNLRPDRNSLIWLNIEKLIFFRTQIIFMTWRKSSFESPVKWKVRFSV